MVVALALAGSSALVGCGADDGEPGVGADTSETPTPVETTSGATSLASVQSDVENLAVSLESFYRGTPYPQTVDEVIASLPDAGLSLSPGNSIGSYVYDPDAVEFTLCVEDDAGAWASYDTAPMSVRDTGESGGCP